MGRDREGSGGLAEKAMGVGIVVFGSDTEKLSVMGMVEGTRHVPNLYDSVARVDERGRGDKSMLVGSLGSCGP